MGIQWCESTLWFRYALARVLAPKLTGYDDARTKMHAAMGSMKEIVQRHRDTMLDRDEEEHDFIDLYLKRVGGVADSHYVVSERDNERGWGGETGLRRLMGALDTIPLGSDGLFVAFNTIIYCLSRYAEEQEKLREELEEAEEGVANANLPYLKAFVMEVLRFSQTAGLGPVKVSEESITVGKYVIPPWVS